jgi:hypothetical protein
MSDWSDNICALIATIPGGSLVRGTNFFRAKHPVGANPDAVCVVMRPTQGRPDEIDGLIRFPRFQISVRARSYDAAQAEADRLYVALSAVRHTRLGTSGNYTLLLSITGLGPPFPIGQDEQNCWLIVANYEAELQAA